MDSLAVEPGGGGSAGAGPRKTTILKVDDPARAKAYRHSDAFAEGRERVFSDMNQGAYKSLKNPLSAAVATRSRNPVGRV